MEDEEVADGVGEEDRNAKEEDGDVGGGRDYGERGRDREEGRDARGWRGFSSDFGGDVSR